MSSEIIPIETNEIRLAKEQHLEKVVEAFLSSQDVKPSSRGLYKRTLKQYLSWIEAQGLTYAELTRAEIVTYKEAQIAQGLSSLTIGSYLTAVRKFYEYLEANKLYPNIAKGIKTPKRKQAFRKQALSPEQVKTLLAHFGEAKDLAVRDYAILNLMLRTGLRTIEVITANIEDITYKQGKRVLLVQGKGEIEKNNFVILTDKAYQPIADYLATRGQANSKEPLFTSTSNNSLGERLTTRTISKIAKEALRAVKN